MHHLLKKRTDNQNEHRYIKACSIILTLQCVTQQHNSFFFLFSHSYQHCLRICPGVYWRTEFHCPGGNHRMMHKTWCHHLRPEPGEVGNEYPSGLQYETPSSALTSVLLHTHTMRACAVTVERKRNLPFPLPKVASYTCKVPKAINIISPGPFKVS